jgi:hypothetical protein
LLEVQARVQRPKRQLRGKDKIALAVGAVVNHYKMAKHFTVVIADDDLTFERKIEQIEAMPPRPSLAKLGYSRDGKRHKLLNKYDGRKPLRFRINGLRQKPRATFLTWAGLAPADRASFAWRLPLFDHLVGALILLSPEHSRQPAVQCELGKGCALRVGEQRGYNKKPVDAFLRHF